MARRWFRRGLWSAGVALLSALGWVFFFPVPLGWAVRAVLPHALPPGNQLGLQLEALTLRWRWGDAALRLEIEGIAVRERAVPLATVKSITVEVNKAGLWQGHYAPAAVVVKGATVAVDLRPVVVPAVEPSRPVGRALAAGAKLPGAAGGAWLAPWLAFLPKETQPVSIRVEDLRASIRNEAGEVPWAFGLIETKARRKEEKFLCEFSAALAGKGPVPTVTIEAEMPCQHRPETHLLPPV